MIDQNKDITAYTTFKIPVKAKYYAEYSNVKELEKITFDETFLNNNVLYLGGGSNLLFIRDFDGLVLRSTIKGITRYDKDSDTAYAIVGSGVEWSEFTDWAIENNLGGVENMVGIPGTVGAAPVQNVGAYGVEAKDVIYSVECYDTLAHTTRRFSNKECQFGYRNSFFKHEGKGRFIVLRVCFRLKKSTLAANLEYGPLAKLQETFDHTPSIKEVADEIIRIRSSKLPDVNDLGSAGSFFKNPVIPNGYLKEIEVLTGEKITGHSVGENYTKVSAAWLIDKAGMKGQQSGGAQVYEQQPLVIVNTGHATGRDVVTLALKVQKAVREKFMINLEPEVNYIDTSIYVRLLGTGTSKGIPEIGCSCTVCTSPSDKDKRTRTSALVQTMGKTILIDPSPDFRQQALAAQIHHIDAVLITHSHYDHVGGIDDLRPFCADGPLPMYMNQETERDLRKHYDYCFREHPYPGVPTFKINVVGNSPFYIDGIKIEPISVMHAQLPILGYRIGNFAYITDAKTIAESEMYKLKGVEMLVINALRNRQHFSHLSLEEALRLIKEISPRKAYLTHFNHEIGRHEDLARRLPSNVEPGYDGLEFEA